jgi:hypothetical protein
MRGSSASEAIAASAAVRLPDERGAHDGIHPDRQSGARVRCHGAARHGAVARGERPGREHGQPKA